MKKIIELTNKYIVTATPLILFTLLTSVYLAITAGSGKIVNLLAGCILFVFMTAAFISGWFNMIKNAVLNPDSDEPNSLIKDFVPGVGEYFIPSFGLMVISFFLSLLILIFAFYTGMHFIGNPNISIDEFAKALTNTETLKAFLSGLSTAQLVKISMWNMFLLCTTSLNWFLIMFYIPALFLETKNPLKAFFISLKNLFSKHFIKNTAIYLLIFVLYFLISIFTAMFSSNPLLNFIMTLINFYYICATALGIFYYYNKTFIEGKLGKNVDTYI